MHIDPDGESLVFDNGETMHANCGLVGIAPDGRIAEGFDCGIEVGGRYGLSDEECRELAAHMIARWREFGVKHGLQEKEGE